MLHACLSQLGYPSKDCGRVAADEVVEPARQVTLPGRKPGRLPLSDDRSCHFLILILLLCTSCHAPSNQPTIPPPPSRSSPADAARSYKIGALLPLSGPMAPFGQEVLHGIQLAMDQQNHDTGQGGGTLVVRDTAVGGNTSLQDRLSALLDEPRLMALIGPLVSQQVEAVAKVVDDAKVPLITPTATLAHVRQLSPYLFSAALPYPVQAEQLAAYVMGRLGYRRFGVIHPDNSYGRQLAHFFIEEVRRQGGEVIHVESYREDQTDFAKQITRLKSAYWKRVQEDRRPNREKESGNHTDKKVQRALPRRSLDAIYLPGAFRHAILIATQLRFHEMKVQLLGSNAWHTTDLAHFPDRSIEGGIFVDSFFAESRTRAVREFVEAYRARYHAEPSMFAAQAYEATQVVLEGVRNSITSGKKLRAYLEQTDSLPTLQGPTSFSRDGVLNRKLFVLQVGEKGQLIPLR